MIIIIFPADDIESKNDVSGGIRLSCFVSLPVQNIKNCPAALHFSLHNYDDYWSRHAIPTGSEARLTVHTQPFKFSLPSRFLIRMVVRVL